MAVLRPRAGLASIGGLFMLSVSLGADPPPPTEYEVKVAYLFKFAHFVEWPAKAFPTASSPFVFAVLGKDPFGPLLDRLEGRLISGRQVTVKRFTKTDELEHCHVLYVGELAGGNVADVLEKARGWSMLTASDADHFTAEGGMVRFFLESKKVRFEINLIAAEEAGLKLSSKLLKVGKIFPGKKKDREAQAVPQAQQAR